MKYLIVIFTCLLFSCGNIQRVDTTAVKEKMNDYKVRKIADKDIVLTAESWGKIIADSISKSPDMMCETIDKKYKLQLINLPNAQTLEPKVKELIDAYAFAKNSNQIIDNNIQKINDSTVLYSFSAPKSTKCAADLVLLYLPKREIIRKVK